MRMACASAVVTPGLGRGMALAPCALRLLTGVGSGMRLALASLLFGSPVCSFAGKHQCESVMSTGTWQLQGVIATHHCSRVCRLVPECWSCGQGPLERTLAAPFGVLGPAFSSPFTALLTWRFSATDSGVLRPRASRKLSASCCSRHSCQSQNQSQHLHQKAELPDGALARNTGCFSKSTSIKRTYCKVVGRAGHLAVCGAYCSGRSGVCTVVKPAAASAAPLAATAAGLGARHPGDPACRTNTLTLHITGQAHLSIKAY